MKNNSVSQIGVAIGALVSCWLPEAHAGGVAALAGGLDGHPVLSALVHIVFLSVLLGVGSTVIAVLFKTPFRE